MANIIEIRVKTVNDTAEGLDAARADAAAAAEEIAASFQAAGADGGARYATGLRDATADLGTVVAAQIAPEIEDTIGDSGRASGAAFTSAFSGELASGLSSTGVFGGSVGDMIGKEGDPAGREFSAAFSQSAKDGLLSSTLAAALAPEGDVGDQMVQDAEKTGKKAGEDAGNAAGDGMAPLMLAAIGGVAALGAPLLLTGLGGAFVGVAAMALKSNAVIAADYTQLGKNAEAAIKQAAAPLAGDLNVGLDTLDGTVKALQPQLDSLFANVGPDITQVADGVSAFATGVLPGVSRALGSSQVIVRDFSASLGPLGSNVGSFFTGLSTDAYATGAGMQSAFGVIGNAVSTVGSVLGSASTAISADLLAIDPAINGLLTGVRAIASPATIGAIGGAFAAMKLDPAVGKGLQSVSDGFLNIAAKADGAEGVLGKVGGAAESASGSFSTMADVMGGPAGIAIGAAIGLASGLAGSLFNAAKASDALTLSQQGLTQAVAQDQGTAGASTAAYVAQTFAADGLSKSAAAAGVSTTTWTQAVLGSSSAQQKVLDAVDKTNQATVDQTYSTNQATASTGKFSDEQKDAAGFVDGTVISTNRLTTQNQQLVNSLNAQTKQVADAISAQTTYQKAMGALSTTTELFNASLTAGERALVASAQASALTTVANLNLGSSNSTVSQSLDKTLIAYQETSSQASAYGSVLQSLNGTALSAAQAQNTLASDMVSAKKTFDANSDSLKLNTAAGVSDRQALVAASQAIVAMGVAQFQSSGSMNDANKTIQQQITAYVAATGATGKAKQAILSYLESITQIPPNVSTTVHANTANALAEINQVNGALQNLMQSSIPGAAGLAGVEIARANRASGGPVAAAFAAQGGSQYGGPTMINEQGPELVNLPNGSQVMPAANTASMLAGSGFGGFGGAQRIELEWVGGDGPLFDALRAGIRARAGGGANSVQRALGQVS
jgi:hypothetical protein